MQKKYKLLVVCGKAGSGKNFFMDKLKEYAAARSKDFLNWVVADTTRPPRLDEEDGIDYNFLPVDSSPLSILASKTYLEISTFNNWFYGTPLSSLDEDKINILITSPRGIEQLYEHSDILDLKVYYFAQSNKQRLLNQLNREEYPNCYEICRRFFADEKDFAFLTQFNTKTDFHTINLAVHSMKNTVEKILKETEEWYTKDSNN